MPILTPTKSEQQTWTNELVDLINTFGPDCSKPHVTFDLDGWGYVSYVVREMYEYPETVRALTSTLVVVSNTLCGLEHVITRDSLVAWIMNEALWDEIKPQQAYVDWIRNPIKELEL